jgi:hypothetical protein
MAKILVFNLPKSELDKINELAKNGQIAPVQLHDRRPSPSEQKPLVTLRQPQPPKKAA